MPHLKKLHAGNKDKGLVLIGIHSKNGGDRMPAFVEKEKIDYPVAHDHEGKTVKAYGGNSYPDYFLIDRKGVLRFADLANAELDKAVALLLAEDEGSGSDAPAEEETEPEAKPAPENPKE